VVDTAAIVTGRAIAVRTAVRRPGDPAVLVASSEPIRKELGWAPRHERLEDIIASARGWMRLRGLAGVA